MAIRVLFFASLADITGLRETEVDPAGFRDVDSIFTSFASRYPQLEAHRKSLHFALNSVLVDPDTPVREGDEVAFLPPVSGG